MIISNQGSVRFFSSDFGVDVASLSFNESLWLYLLQRFQTCHIQLLAVVTLCGKVYKTRKWFILFLAALLRMTKGSRPENFSNLMSKLPYCYGLIFLRQRDFALIPKVFSPRLNEIPLGVIRRTPGGNILLSHSSLQGRNKLFRFLGRKRAFYPRR